jgi:hypothetical protein
VRVVVSLRTRSDILDIHSYLAERSLVAADRILALFLNDSTNCVNFLCSVLTEANFDHRCAAF